MLVIGMVAMSLDGCLTRHDVPGTGFVSPADRQAFQAALAECDCILMGRKTFDAGRERIAADRDSGRLRMVLTTRPGAFEDLARPGALEFVDLSAPEAITTLAERGHRRCSLLGGSALYTAAAAAGLMQQLWITVEPVAFGSGVRMFEGRADFHYRLESAERLSPDGTILLRYHAV